MLRRLTLTLVVAIAGFGLLGAAVASAETYTIPANENPEVVTAAFKEDLTKCNAAATACTIQLGSGTYLPTSTIVIENTNAQITLEGPAGTPTTSTPGAVISGSSFAEPGELFTIEAGSNVKLKNVQLTTGGGSGYPVVEVSGTNDKSKIPGAILTVENSTLNGTGNILAVEPGATLTASNSTISDSRAYGIFNAGKVKLINSTVAYNKEVGIENIGEETSLTNTIVAENTGGDCVNTVTTSDHSLDSDGSCGVGTLSKTNPNLNKNLINDGGSVPLHVVKPGSPAINAGDKTTCLTVDEPYATRPGITGDACTVGADEYTNTPPSLTVPSNISKEGEASGASVTYEASAVGVNDRVVKLTCTGGSEVSSASVVSPVTYTGTFPVGTTKVKCTATDGHENVTTSEFTITVTLKKEEPLKEGHPQLYSNGAKVEAEAKAVAVLGYGDVELKSEQLPGGFVECTSAGIGSGFNTGTPVRGKGKILSYMAAGHAPTSTHKELSSECRGLGGKAWVTDEKPVKPESALNAKRGELTVPWNVEGICRINESEEATTIVVVGVPTTLTTAQKEAREKRKCVEAAAEPTEITNEISKKEGCYASNPAPEGCIGVLIIDPEISLELNYGGSLRAVAKNGTGSGLNQSKWEFKGASSGELQCQSSGCTAKGITTGVVKQQGFESVQLLTYK